MRITCAFTIALCVTFPAAAIARQQEPSDTANSSPQAPATPAEKPAADAPAQEKKPAEAAASSKQQSTSDSVGAVPAGGGQKRHKRVAPPPEDGPRKIVVRRGGASEPAAQIAPGMTPAEAVRQRENTERLLEATGDQLQMLAERTLDAKRQEMVGQIRNYMDHARLALKEGDLRRANTLAEKAHLLSDDLVRR